VVTERTESSIFVITGARKFSLGAAVVDELSKIAVNSIILAIDLEPIFSPLPNVRGACFDLDPFKDEKGFLNWSANLNRSIRSLAHRGAAAWPIRGIFLGAAKYQAGRYQATTDKDRASTRGCNVMGKLEVLHSVMRLNAESGFKNEAELDVLDIGSFHAIRHTHIVHSTLQPKQRAWSSAGY
jgi:hypothetical protein